MFRTKSHPEKLPPRGYETKGRLGKSSHPSGATLHGSVAPTYRHISVSSSSTSASITVCLGGERDRTTTSRAAPGVADAECAQLTQICGRRSPPRGGGSGRARGSAEYNLLWALVGCRFCLSLPLYSRGLNARSAITLSLYRSRVMARHVCAAQLGIAGPAATEMIPGTCLTLLRSIFRMVWRGLVLWARKDFVMFQTAGI